MKTNSDVAHVMLKRIRRILLVCNNYDSFSLEEDGHIEELISREYAELNLSNPPSIERAESTVEALEQLKNNSYDLIIALYNVRKLDIHEFSFSAKQLAPNTPIVLLSSFSKEIYKHISRNDISNVDYVFCWNNNADVIIAIIKLLEDSLNAEHDILQMGVRAILLVEDSVRYYSAYLPLLYKLILQQNSDAIRDTLNEEQQIMRKRGRPKILMANCYDEAVRLYKKYKDNILGVISDIGFVVHKGDKPQDEKIDAGLDLCSLVRSEDPTIPFLLQSSQESMRGVAKEMGVGFALKSSKTLTHEMSEYIGHEFGFGDFIITDPETGQEIMRAKNLYEFERLMATIPDDIFKSLAQKNYISRWMYARGMFSIADKFRPVKIHCDSEIDEIRKVHRNMIHDYRISQGLGVVAKFSEDSFNDTIWFSRVGNGSLGGKARGLAFLNHILHKYDLYDKWEDTRVLVPRTMVVTTEYFDQFIIDNGLTYVINSDITDAEILSEFVASTLPPQLITALKKFIHTSRKPLAVRSSSKLEDSYYQPFAGVYSTYMIPRTENEDQMLRLLTKAIKSVYASVYFASSRGYIVSTANVISEEKMAIVIQEICGKEDNGYYFPTLSGVARSVNFYPIGYEKPEEGIVKLAFGLGKAVVDGEQVIRFSPSYPQNSLQLSTPELIMKETQQVMYALNLLPDKFKTSVDDSINLERIKISDASKFRDFSKLVSTWDYRNMRMDDSNMSQGAKYLTFARILKYNGFPLADIIRELLNIAREEVKSEVEIEFAVEMKEDGLSIFNILQIRPISNEGLNTKFDWDDDAFAKSLPSAFVYSDRAIGPGLIEGVKHIVYIKPDAFDILRTKEIAAELSQINQTMRGENKNYVLIGYGRWGSCIPSLGIPVQWSDISEASVVVEASLPDFAVEPSQGTHFFQNLTSFNAGYVNVNPYSYPNEILNIEALNACPSVQETEYLRVVKFDEDLQICIDGQHSKAIISL